MASEEVPAAAAQPAATAASAPEGKEPVNMPPWRMPAPVPDMLQFFETCYPLKVQNSLTRSKTPFVPMNGRQVTWYMCGPTVYDSAHMGHARTYIVFDILRRIMEEYFAYDVTLVMNITDIDDKIIARSQERSIPFAQLARTFEAEFFDDMKSLGVKLPHVVTRVSEYVPEVVDMIQQIIDNGFAYPSNGSVYFDVPAFKRTQESGHSYGKLVPENVGDEAALAEGEGRLSESVGLSDKRSVMDFALWKASKEGEPSWASPWGEGRPGWHIECSAMATAAFKGVTGGAMDIHSGGVDLRFPHHDNELAQAEAALGIKQWVNYFVHSGHLNIDGQKMSKSLKNFVKIHAALERFPARHLRLLFLLHKYNAPMDYNADNMGQVADLDRGFKEFFANTKVKLRALQGGAAGIGDCSFHFGAAEVSAHSKLLETQRAVHAALCDDFDTPSVIRLLQSLVSDTNKYMAGDAIVPSVLSNAAGYVSRIFRVFGLIEPSQTVGFSEGGAGGASKEETVAPFLDALANFRATVRDAGRSGDTAGILAACDALRDDVLPPLGVRLEDAGASGAAAGSGGGDASAPTTGAIWKLEDPAELLREAEAKAEAAAAKAAEKAAKAEAAAAAAAEKARIAAIPPAEYLAGLQSDGGVPLYSAFGEDGLPTADGAGEELSKGAVKKAKKALTNHEKVHAKWLKAQQQ